ncbi:hypothetical protein Tco_1392366 [Tanacetum coccineum]
MCMFVLAVSTAEPKNIKEAIADSKWIKSMQDELHQFDRLQVCLPSKESSRWIEASSKILANYALEILKKHGMDKCDSLGTPLDTKPKLDVDLSEAEYVALSASCAQVMWTRTHLNDYGFNYNKIPLYCDSKSAISISCNPVQHCRTKHINVRYHFIKEQIEREDMSQYLVRRIGMRCLTLAELEVLENESA